MRNHMMSGAFRSFRPVRDGDIPSLSVFFKLPLQNNKQRAHFGVFLLFIVSIQFMKVFKTELIIYSRNCKVLSYFVHAS